ncbi:hypothetical protein T01_11402 [Trichinella spiralis]|uniref:Uncharacterized protein n=1 Tax=Trichinella spiralis TaxID=6334 RepID=A0A0V1AKF2_TRISP|nr:hypothetical protein T01_11402 [Trichinella spiralis]
MVTLGAIYSTPKFETKAYFRKSQKQQRLWPSIFEKSNNSNCCKSDFNRSEKIRQSVHTLSDDVQKRIS